LGLAAVVDGAGRGLESFAGPFPLATLIFPVSIESWAGWPRTSALWAGAVVGGGFSGLYA